MRLQIEPFSETWRGRLQSQLQRATAGRCAAGKDLLGEAQQRKTWLGGMGLTDEDALTLPADEYALMRQGVERLHDGNAANAVQLAELADGWNLLTWAPFARGDAFANCLTKTRVQRRASARQRRRGWRRAGHA